MPHRKHPKRQKKVSSRKERTDPSLSEPETAYRTTRKGTSVVVFKVKGKRRKREFTVESGYGHFISSFRRVGDIKELSALVDRGIASKELKAITEYLALTIQEIAKAADVSPSTVSRWEPETAIGSAGSHQFFRMDEVIRKGIDAFGGAEEFRVWLQTPNLALGDVAPVELMISHVGVQMVADAVDALHYGNIL